MTPSNYRLATERIHRKPITTFLIITFISWGTSLLLLNITILDWAMGTLQQSTLCSKIRLNLSMEMMWTRGILLHTHPLFCSTTILKITDIYWYFYESLCLINLNRIIHDVHSIIIGLEKDIIILQLSKDWHKLSNPLPILLQTCEFFTIQ